MDRKDKCCCEDNVCLCSTEGVLDLISKKWTLCIINHLGDKEEGYRFNELERSMDGISPKSLSNRLKELEEHGLVEREVKDTKPPEVRYILTQQGVELNERLEPLLHWINERNG
ncbi:MAG: winged helix-turn-helix transcriptional regulator [Candidatus Aenigmatarchaeota archaeon]